MGFLARVGYTNPSSDDSEDDDDEYDATSDLNATVDEAWINNNAWVKPWEANGNTFAEADKGDSFGFMAMTKHEANVEISEDEEAEESTIGQAGMGRVINDIDAASEQALYSEMRKVLGTPLDTALRHVLSISIIVGCLVASWYTRDYAISVAYVIMAAVTAKSYIGE